MHTDIYDVWCKYTTLMRRPQVLIVNFYILGVVHNDFGQIVVILTGICGGERIPTPVTRSLARNDSASRCKGGLPSGRRRLPQVPSFTVRRGEGTPPYGQVR